jgi:heme exporter protein D
LDEDPIQPETEGGEHAEPTESASRPAGSPRAPSTARTRMPSTSGYLATAGATALALFFLLWWMLHNNGDEAPWIPAGLAASVVMLVALAAREVVMRRALTRQILDQERRDYRVSDVRKRPASASSTNNFSATFRNLQRRSAEADSIGSQPTAHLDVYKLCRLFLENSEEALRSVRTGAQGLATLRAGQERARLLQKHHLLTWAAGEARVLTADAQRRSNIADKIETATRALDVIDSALKVYPDEPELLASAGAVREYISSVKVAHWIELAERAAFKGQFRRAIDRYRDALFYLSREEMREETRDEMAIRIAEEVDELRGRLRSQRSTARQRSAAENNDSAETIE